VFVDDLVVVSVIDFWFGVAWYECEICEMFGVDFIGFDDGACSFDGELFGLCLLLLFDGFEGIFLCKSFVFAVWVSKFWLGVKELGESDIVALLLWCKMLFFGVLDVEWGLCEFSVFGDSVFDDSVIDDSVFDDSVIDDVFDDVFDDGGVGHV